ncbi:dienelactone hydrolase family protein [Tessaracoccus caeni]|uniref:dienelactone hydrolase family protein n=1 Tax=Tessaracoccus caeni TaxID=3031239 RepID=UPI0023D98517|nr:alpha/beta hydrolase [Tessaracoccus caeni]MDF1488388.1 alpha/beta hydrolase [Tessaracoccus caeni]
MHFTSEQRLDGDILERAFTLSDIPGILWTPPSASSPAPVPVILMGQPGGIGMQRMYPRLAARAQGVARHGFAAVCVELPGAGDRPRLPDAEQARADLVRAISAGRAPSGDVIDRLVLPLVDQAVPEWQATLDEVLTLPEIGDRVGISGGVIAVGTRMAAEDSRVVAASLFAGTYVPQAIMEQARDVTIPLHVLLQWDDENNDRQMALDLFDAFGSKEKTLYANMGGHTGVPEFAGEDVVRFFARHLSPSQPTATSAPDSSGTRDDRRTPPVAPPEVINGSAETETDH